jgi:hypothetical protein
MMKCLQCEDSGWVCERHPESGHYAHFEYTLWCERGDLSLPTSVYRAATSGGSLGLIRANATWMMPPARPSATPMRQAML